MNLRTTAHVLAEMELPDDGVISIEVRCRMDLLEEGERRLVEALFDLMGATMPAALIESAPAPGTAGDEGVGEVRVAAISSATTQLPDPEPEAEEPELPPAAAEPAKRAIARNAAATDRPTGLRMNPESDRGIALLRGLHELGGEINDPSGKAATKLRDHIGWEGTAAAASTLLAVLEEVGHITRTVNGKRTTRIALQPSGLAVLDGPVDDPAPAPASTTAPAEEAPDPDDEAPACPRCGANFTFGDIAKRLRQHLVTAHGISETEARRMVREVS